MTKYLITSVDGNPIVATALDNGNKVVVHQGEWNEYSLEADGDNFLYHKATKGGDVVTTKICGDMLFALPELISIMAMERRNMFGPVTIAKVEALTTLFENKTL